MAPDRRLQLYSDVFRCPRCAGSLTVKRDDVVCMWCHTRFSAAGGIIDFVAGGARTQLDDIDYDQVYSISECRADSIVTNIVGRLGTRWPSGQNSIGTMLEVGAGTGGSTMALAQLSELDRLIVTDVSPKMLRICRAHLERIGVAIRDVSYATYSTTEKCFRPSSIGLCFGTSVLHHITDVAGFLADLSSMLKPGGAAIFLEPNRRFHRGLIATLADIVAEITLTDRAPDGLDIPRALNLISEIRCNLAHQGDLAFLATREDKHLFVPDELDAVARRCGFASLEALDFGPDPLAESTLRVYLGQLEVAQSTIEMVCALLPKYAPKHMGGLKPEDRSPSYLLYLVNPADKQETFGSRLRASIESLRRRLGLAGGGNGRSARSMSDEGPVQDGIPDGTRYSIHIDTVPGEGGSQTAIKGWFLARADIRWLEIEFRDKRIKCDVRHPSLDVHQALNRNGEYPAANALSCRILETFPSAVLNGQSLDVRMKLTMADGSRYALPAPQAAYNGTSAVLTR